VAPRPRSSPPPDGERDRRSARGLGPRSPRPPGGWPGDRPASGVGSPVQLRYPTSRFWEPFPEKVWVQVDRGSPEIAARLWGWSGPAGLTTDRGGLPGSGTAPAPSLAVPDAIFLGTRSPHAGGFPGRLWLRGEDWGAWGASRGARPGAPAGSTSPGTHTGSGSPGTSTQPSGVAGPRFPGCRVPRRAAHGSPARRPPVPCKHRTRTPPRTVPWSTSPGHRPRLVGLRAGRRRPEPERGQEAPLCAWTRSNHGPGGTGHGPVCWDVVLRVCSPRCCHLPCAPVARVRQTRVPCPPRSPSFHRNKRGPGRFSTQVPGTGTRNR
jgi:hypothetical protein